jgi:hypothetical protein
MDKQTTGIVATIAAVLLCGCPGLLGLCWGAIAIPASLIPGADIDIFGSSDAQAAFAIGIVALCLGVILVAIPVVVGFVTLRDKKEPTPVSDEPIPPAI